MLLQNLLGDDFPFSKVADSLSRQEIEHGIRLSAYGFFRWALDNRGYNCAYKNVMASPKVAEGYASTACKMRDDMPYMLLNAATYVSNVLSNVPNLDTCLAQLRGMTFPYVLYVYFAGSGQEDIVEVYRTEMVEQLRRYPSTLDLLPEPYRSVGREVLDADADKL